MQDLNESICVGDPPAKGKPSKFRELWDYVRPFLLAWLIVSVIFCLKQMVFASAPWLVHFLFMAAAGTTVYWFLIKPGNEKEPPTCGGPG